MMDEDKAFYLDKMCICNVLLRAILDGRIDVSQCAFKCSFVDESSHSLVMDLIGGDKVIEKMSADVDTGTFFIITKPMNDGMESSAFDLVHSNGNKIPFNSDCEVVYRDRRGMRYEAFLFYMAEGAMTNDSIYNIYVHAV